jgi:PAS domain S-box-containing protein
MGKQANVLIVGAGRGGTAIIELFSGSGSVNIQGVVDKNNEAPGMALAREKGLATSNDYRDFLEKEGLSEIINVTGSEEVQKELVSAAPHGVAVIGGHSANLIWRMVDERKKADRALEESEKRFHLLSDSTLEGVLIHDGTTVLDSNHFFPDMLGYGHSEVIGKNVLDFIDPSSRDLALKHITEDYDKPYELLARKKDGSIFPAEVYGRSFDFEGRKTRVVAVRDITERKRAEERLMVLNRTLLNLGADFGKNVESITAACGELLGGACALYNRVDKGLLCSWGKWHTPSDYRDTDDPRGHICYDVILNGKRGEPYVVQNLDKSLYAKTDPNVLKYGLKTYIGYPVYFKERCVGSLCVVYQEDVEFGESDKWFLGILGDAVSREEERRKATEELRRKEEDYRKLFDNAADLIAVVDTKGNIIDLNEKFEEESFYKRSEMIGKNMLKSGILTKESAAKCMFHLLGLLKGIEPPIFEVDGIRKDGEIINYELRSVPIKEGDNIIAVQAILRNITFRRKAEAALRENEEKLRLITENTSDLVAISTLRGVYTYLSPSHRQVLGYEPEELLGKSAYDFIHPNDAKNIKRIALKYTERKIRQIFARGEKTAGEMLEFRFRNKAGEWRNMESTGNVVGGPKGKGFYVIFISRDVTERKRILRELYKQKELLSNIISTVPHFVFWKDTESVYLGCNENFARVAGVGSPENIIGKTDYDLAWKKEESDFFCQCDREVMETRRPMLNIEEPQLQADGKEATLLTSKVPLMDPDGNVFGILGIYADITERKNMEEILRESEARYRTIFENTGTATVIIEENLTIAMANTEFVKFSGCSKKEIQGRLGLLEFIHQDEMPRIKEFHRIRKIDPEAAPRQYEVRFVDRGGEEREVYATVAMIPGTERSVVSLLDITELKQNERELKRQKELLDNTNKALEHKLKELGEAMGHIKKLEGLVPICARCKKMRSEGGDPKDEKSWISLEKYISDRTDASFTHGLCPDCIKELYGDTMR